ncbi:MAG TPA: AraC family transcriptional regulator ligand-binding domain-containing protein [Burkholderiaceae bacterium]|nr:AraC family transcriptional regulator ligand-binding domain-containing protein [Burkholderiaceae bacterium]
MMREPVTTSVAACVLAQFIAARGDAASLAALQQLPVTIASLAESDAEVALPVFGELWRIAARIEPAIGLQLMRQFLPEQMHFVGHIVVRAATLREALGLWCRYAGLVCASDELVLREEGDLAHLAYRSLDVRFHLPWLVEHYACLALACLRRFTDSAAGLSAVQFSHQPLADTAQYSERLGCEVRFGAPHDRFSFSRAHLDRPMTRADSYLKHFLEQQAQARLARAPRTLSLAEQVREACAQRLLAHQGASLEEVATQLGVTESAMQRQLHAQEASFRDLLDDAKKQVAQALLRRGLPLVLISEQLGFAEPPVLQRACKRWFGVSAGEMRQRLMSGLEQ